MVKLFRKKRIKSDKTLEKQIIRQNFIIDEQLIQDLIDFSGLNRDYIMKHLNRENNFSYSYEYEIRNPRNNSELEWFYISSEKYLFATITHKPWQLIDKIRENKILDYGGGTGIDTFYLANKGYNVHYFDISIIQKEFVKFRKKKYSIENVTILEPFFESKFDPINCITETYDGILIRSLLEHVLYYAELVEHLVSKLNDNCIIYEASKFGPSKKKPDHISEKEPLEKVFKRHGLELIFQEGVHRCWKKKG